MATGCLQIGVSVMAANGGLLHLSSTLTAWDSRPASLTTQVMVTSTRLLCISHRSGLSWVTHLRSTLQVVDIVKIFLIPTLSAALALMVHQAQAQSQHLCPRLFRLQDQAQRQHRAQVQHQAQVLRILPLSVRHASSQAVHSSRTQPRNSVMTV